MSNEHEANWERISEELEQEKRAKLASAQTLRDSHQALIEAERSVDRARDIYRQAHKDALAAGWSPAQIEGLGLPRPTRSK